MQGQTSQTIIEGQLQRKLRNTSTDAERKLWQHLRGRQFGDCKFRRQHPFGDFIVDFVCLERRLVIELDGGQHARATRYDAPRTKALEQAGFTVLRFWNNDAFDNIEGVLEIVWRALRLEGQPIPSQPSP